MKNILLVFTGGTIGSQLDNGTIDTCPSAGFKLLELFQEQFLRHRDIRFKTLQPLQILSENLHPSVWRNVIAAIEAEDLNEFDGIIVTHGTDTLAFSAATLGLYFNGLRIPMLLVSSDLPLDNPQANGLRNFICAVEFILQNRGRGVFVPYQNPGQGMHIHIGTRLSSCLPLSGDFISVQSKAFMTFESGQFSQLQPLPALDGTKNQRQLKAQFARVLLIRPYPGLDYSVFDLNTTDLVLHDLYHSGTACASPQWGEHYNLITFSQHCRNLGVPLYLAPAILTDSAYSSTRQLLAQGAKMIWNTTLETAFAKLSLAYGNFDDEQTIDDFLTANIAGEHI